MSSDNTVTRTFGSLVRRLRSSRSGETDTQLAKVQPDLDADDLTLLRETISQALNPATTPERARARATEIGATYLTLSDTGKERFFELLANDYGPDNAAIDAAIEHRAATTDPVEATRANVALREALQPPRIRLLRYFNALDAGVKFLVDMRADMRRLRSKEPQRQAFDVEVRDLLAGWFDVGLLQLQRITWETPASVLEKLIEYEAVHDIASWDDLKRRLAPDRRLFAFFHPGMPGEPLIFVEVALTHGIARAIEPLLDPNEPIADPAEMDTAIFYSISNCQQGLAGVPLGDFLIKRVVGQLQENVPHIETFSTLSPMPGFHSWVDGLIESGSLRRTESQTIVDVTETPQWWLDPALLQQARPALLGLAARYLITERAAGRVVDPVARFHLSNGARVERILFLGNPSTTGQERGLGMMVNYRYMPNKLVENQRAYLNEDTVVASDEVLELLAARSHEHENAGGGKLGE